MKPPLPQQNGKPGLVLIEEAFVLLRSCAPSALAIYYIGSVPFVAGFLIFWSDFSRNPHAADHLAAGTLAVAGLFVWMKFCHARFAARLLAQLGGREAPALSARCMFRSVAIQTIVQSTGLVVLPLAALITLPFAWAYAFYQNATALDDGESDLQAVFKNASKQSANWPAQNHLILLVLSGFGLVVFLNLLAIGFATPWVVKILFGIESAFTRSPLSMLNTTFFAAMAALTYLCVDPLIKSCYVQRCFYGNSLQSGDDLKAGLRRFSSRAQALAILLFLGGSSFAVAQPAGAPAPAVSGADLERSIASVIEQERYTWRLPHEKVREKRFGLIRGFFRQVGRLLKAPMRSLWRLLEQIIEWLASREHRSRATGEKPVWATPPAILLFAVLAAVAAVLALFVLRLIRSRRPSVIAQSTALPAIPDLDDENTAAGDLPEDSWSQLGRQLIEKGDLRLALRAFYLAGLAHLSAQGLLTIARHKSNRDYEREVRRRGHAMPELPALFGENVGIIDRVWYGRHEVSPDLVERFVNNLKRMKSPG